MAMEGMVNIYALGAIHGIHSLPSISSSPPVPSSPAAAAAVTTASAANSKNQGEKISAGEGTLLSAMGPSSHLLKLPRTHLITRPLNTPSSQCTPSQHTLSPSSSL